MGALAEGVRADEPTVRDASLSQSGNVPPREAANTQSVMSPSPHLPVIDLAPVLAQAPSSCGQGRAGVVSAMNRAAKDWGFFQVVNHGIPLELLERTASLCREFFCLPAEQKEQGSTSKTHADGYSKYSTGVLLEGITLKSILAEPSRAERFANSIWPGGNPAFCEAVWKVSRELEDLKTCLLEILAEGLGLPSNFFNRPFEELKAAGKPNPGANFRVNFYPPAEPSLVLGTGIHTDPTILTILYQDTGNGLHILEKDEKTWHLAEHRRDGIVVFLGDVLQGWSSGGLLAGIHKAVLNNDKNRLSFLMSSNPPPDMLIEPADLPVKEDGDDQLIYKPFTFRDHFASLTNGYMPVDKGRKNMQYIFTTRPSQ